jgi:hypothetical protein
VNDTNDDRCPNVVPATCGECWATTAMGIISSIGTKVIHIKELKKCMCERVSLGTGDEPLNKKAGKVLAYGRPQTVNLKSVETLVWR